MRWLAFAFAALFVLGAVVQLNDPDPMLWMLAYLGAAGLAVAAGLGRRWREANLAATLIFAVIFLSLAPSLRGAPDAAFTSFEMQAESHEEPREAAGLALLTGWSAFLTIWSWRREDR